MLEEISNLCQLDQALEKDSWKPCQIRQALKYLIAYRSIKSVK